MPSGVQSWWRGLEEETAPRASARGLGVWALSPKKDFSPFFSEDEAHTAPCPMPDFLLQPCLGGSLGQQGDQTSQPKGLQFWIFMEGLLLKLKLQYFGYLMWKANILEKTLMLGKIEGRSRRGDRGWNGWMASWTQWTWVWANSRR